MSGHTPGPWRHVADPKPHQAGRRWHWIEAEVDLGDDDLPWVTIGQFYDHTGPLMDDAEIAANARLAAAAPELLQLVKDAVETESEHETEWNRAARAIIAKAEGRA